jgi:hypothetical protein
METPDNKRHKQAPAGKSKAMTALIGGATRAEAAAEGGVCLRTLERWLAEPSFKAELEAGRRATYETALAALKGVAGRAVETLAGLLNSRHESERRHSAAVILSFAFKANEMYDLEIRIAALEKTADELSHRPRGHAL